MRISYLCVLAWMACSAVSAVEYVSFREAITQSIPCSGKIERWKPASLKQASDAALAATRCRAQGSLGGVYVGHSQHKLDAICFIDNVIGRTEYITYCCVLNPDGSVRRVTIMAYREAYGSEIRREAFTQQFISKTATDTVRLHKDISNIAGATMSCLAVTERVRFLTRLYQQYLFDDLATWVEQRPVSPTAPLAGTYAAVRSGMVGSSVLTCSSQENDDEIQQRLERALTLAQTCDAQINSWVPDSDIAALNVHKQQILRPYAVRLLTRAIQWYQQSGGYFNPSIRPLIELWKQAEVAQKQPQAADIERARLHSDFKNCVLDGGKVRIAENMRIDCGALRKGLILDVVAEQLTDISGVLSFGESSFKALHAEQQIALRDPQQLSVVRGSVTLAPYTALACSNAAGQLFTVAGHEMSHLINPFTGEPVSRLRQAWVCAPSAADADVLATLCCIMPIDEVLALLDKQAGCEASIWTGQKFVQTSGWQENPLEKAAAP